ncbi:Lacal_2735 family protein [Seonamhaeicola maritimus]|uniref:Lacal_2735 family protein n=1 Tax=Seonamhaeicola maritimus TaxID=2591822 RepID=A0A5C7GFV7_9FLAO|nr:Lacal_2735 family protein [Seonamhaeicola maritimus]TXG35765.1 Lacal_2735 family protein [Seonamhaeicola maritimus]
MFKIFKKRSEIEKLEGKFKKLMQEWHKLSSVNRAASDKKFAEAQQIAQVIYNLKNEAI